MNLTIFEKEKLRELVQEELKKYKARVVDKFKTEKKAILGGTTTKCKTYIQINT